MHRPSRGGKTAFHGYLKTIHPRLSRGFRNTEGRGESEDLDAQRPSRCANIVDRGLYFRQENKKSRPRCRRRLSLR